MSYASSVEPLPVVDSDSESERYENFQFNKDVINKESLGSKSLVPPRYTLPILASTSFHSQPLESPPIPLQVKFADPGTSSGSDHSTVRAVVSRDTAGSRDDSSEGIYEAQEELSKYLNTYEPPQTTGMVSKTNLGTENQNSRTTPCCAYCAG